MKKKIMLCHMVIDINKEWGSCQALGRKDTSNTTTAVAMCKYLYCCYKLLYHYGEKLLHTFTKPGLAMRMHLMTKNNYYIIKININIR